MNSALVALWSFNMGAVGLLVTLGLLALAFAPSQATFTAFVYVSFAWFVQLIDSGLLAALAPQLNAKLIHSAQILSGPWTGSVGCLWLRAWSDSQARSKAMNTSLWIASIVCMAAGCACFLLPPQLQLIASGLICLLVNITGIAISLRARVLGDALSILVTMGCLLMLPPIVGLYAIMLNRLSTAFWPQFGIVVCQIWCIGFLGAAHCTRTYLAWQAKHPRTQNAQVDAVTGMLTSVSMVKKIIEAQKRRGKAASHIGALIAVDLFDIEHLMQTFGHAGLNEIYIQLAARIQDQVGAVNPVGRYLDNCFIILVEAAPSHGFIRELCDRLLEGACQPMTVSALNGEEMTMEPELTVGATVLSRIGGRNPSISNVLYAAQHAAELARRKPTRVVLVDPDSLRPFSSSVGAGS